jgi:hypothetical protein
MEDSPSKVPSVSTNPLDKPHHQLNGIQLPNPTTTHKRYQRSDSEDDRILNNNTELSKTITSKGNSSEKLNKIEDLLKEGAHVNFTDANRNNNTPLHLSITKNELGILNSVLTRADTTIKNDDGKTPVELAKELKHQEIIAALEGHISQAESHLHLNYSHNSEANTDVSPQGALGLPNYFTVGKALGGDKYFFDTLAQGMNQLSIPGGQFDARLLREACFDYVQNNQHSYYSQTGKTWRQVIKDDAEGGGYAEGSGKDREQDNYDNYMTHIRL